ncbi:hypothetical protein [Cellulomonas sp. PhB143]|uniref:hypothetical protein n=1 Tax=Cellulomonas sp. PhB143 TaxID=2485186 RepID=UPI000F485B6F|nr:hypothetical protein [Cellulomonas sp. PhB143]ROS78784.1 hypothetical protein EDF32_0692 [Cellulomonas sp. PhB143]
MIATPTDARPRPHLVVLWVLALLSVAATTCAVAAERGFVVVHQCVAVDGVPAWLGLHLALVHGSAACPEGTLALGAGVGAASRVVVALALPVLLLHAVAALALAAAGAAAGRSARRSRDLARAPLSAVLRRLGLLAPPQRPVVQRAGGRIAPRPVRGREAGVRHARAGFATVVSWRGPPSVVAA